MAGTATITRGVSTGARSSGIERGSGGISKSTFSSRGLAELSQLRLGKSEISAAGRKVAIGNEKMTIFSSGDLPRRVGLGDHATVKNMSANRTEAPKTISRSTQPTFVEFVPTPLNLTVPEMKKPTGENVLKNTREFQLPVDTVPNSRPSDSIVQQQDILRELRQVSAAHHLKINAAEAEVRAKKRENIKDGVLVEPIPGFDELNSKNIGKVSKEPSSALLYRTLLARREAAKATRDEDDKKIETKQTKFNAEIVSKAVKAKLETHLSKITKSFVQKDELLVKQAKTKVQALIDTHTSLLTQTEQSPKQLAGQIQKVSSTIQTELSRGVALMPQPDSLTTNVKKPQPENSGNPASEGSKDLPYSVDTAAASARLQQVIEAGQIIFNDTKDSEPVSGSEILSVMRGPTQSTTSDIVRDYSQYEANSAVGVDGSEPEWRHDLSMRFVNATNLISEAIRAIKANPPVRRGFGETVSVEDRNRVKRINWREIGRQIGGAFPGIALLF